MDSRAHERGIRYIRKCNICNKIRVTSDLAVDSRSGFTRCCGEETEVMCVLHWQRDKGPAGFAKKCNICQHRFLCVTCRVWA